MLTRAEIKQRAKAQLGSGIFQNPWMTALLACLVSTAICAAAGYIVPGLGAVLISGPIAYGVAAVFLKQTREGGNINVGEIFQGFTKDFGGTFLLGLMVSIFTFLWSLLFVIPGLVKSYSYSQAFYIKVDHPDYDWNQCMKASIKMMSGYKWRLFVQDISFIGWFIVGAACLGVGTLWVEPYFTAARTQFYEARKAMDGDWT